MTSPIHDFAERLSGEFEDRALIPGNDPYESGMRVALRWCARRTRERAREAAIEEMAWEPRDELAGEGERHPEELGEWTLIGWTKPDGSYRTRVAGDPLAEGDAVRVREVRDQRGEWTPAHDTSLERALAALDASEGEDG